MSRFELVIFDNDGVLVRSEHLANAILSDLLCEEGFQVTYEDCVREFMGGTLGRVRQVAEARLGRRLRPSFEDDYHHRLFEAFRTRLEPMPGVRDLLDAIECEVCVASSGSRERIRLALEVTGLAAYFRGDRVFSAEDVARGKPAPDLFLHAARNVGVDPARCIVIEDSPLGVDAAKAAGMTVIGFAALTPADRLAGAHAIARDMREVACVEPRGFEPLASWMPSKRSTN